MAKHRKGLARSQKRLERIQKRELFEAVQGIEVRIGGAHGFVQRKAAAHCFARARNIGLFYGKSARRGAVDLDAEALFRHRMP